MKKQNFDHQEYISIYKVRDVKIGIKNNSLYHEPPGSVFMTQKINIESNVKL